MRASSHTLNNSKPMCTGVNYTAIFFSPSTFTVSAHRHKLSEPSHTAIHFPRNAPTGGKKRKRTQKQKARRALRSQSVVPILCIRLFVHCHCHIVKFPSRHHCYRRRRRCFLLLFVRSAILALFVHDNDFMNIFPLNRSLHLSAFGYAAISSSPTSHPHPLVVFVQFHLNACIVIIFAATFLLLLLMPPLLLLLSTAFSLSLFTRA